MPERSPEDNQWGQLLCCEYNSAINLIHSAAIQTLGVQVDLDSVKKPLATGKAAQFLECLDFVAQLSDLAGFINQRYGKGGNHSCGERFLWCCHGGGF